MPCRRLRALLALAALVAASPARAQLTLIEGPNIESEAPVYVDANGDLHSALVKVKFSEEVVAVPAGTEALTLNDLLPAYPHVRDTLLVLEATYGAIGLVKRYPDVVWGDTLVVDPETQQQVPIADLSQWVELHFGAPVPLDTVAARLKTLPEVEYVDPPYVYHFNTNLDPITPDDGEYDEQWSLPTVSADEAWALARGFVGEGEPVVIGLADNFLFLPDGNPNIYIHPDLDYDPLLGTLRLDTSADENRYGGHGTQVAGMAGAITDNIVGGTAGSVASLAWTVALKGFENDATGIRTAVCMLPGQTGCVPVDVLNMSWSVNECTPDDPPGGPPDDNNEGVDCGELKEALEDALGTATVLTGSTGNAHCVEGNGPPDICPGSMSISCVPCRPWPGGYYSYAHGRGVITVNATDINEGLNTLWNHGFDVDPLAVPDSAFIDLAAPGLDVRTIYTDLGGSHYVVNGEGTSFSAPMTASLVSLLLSVNPDLTHLQVYEVLVRTADEPVVPPPSGTYPHTGLFGEAWDPYYGYGRINAYEAVRYVVEHFGGRIGGTSDTHPYRITAPLTLHDGAALAVRAGTTLDVRAEIVVAEGATLTVEPGATLRFQPAVRLVVEGALVADSTLFTEAVPGQGWGGLLFRVPAMGGATTLPASTLTDCVVEAASRPSGFYIDPRGAVTVSGREVVLDGTEVRSSTGGLWGLLASGAAADVTVTGLSRIRNNAGGGVLATGGADVTVSDPSRIFENSGSAGVWATGYGTEVRLDGAHVLDNTGVGVRASSQGLALFANATSDPRTEVENNAGGLDAATGGLVHAGTCSTPSTPCPGRNVHRIVDNDQSGAYFDARSLSGSVLYAQGNDWEVDHVDDLELDSDGSSVLTVCPLFGGSCGIIEGRQAGEERRDGAGGAPRGGGEPSLRLEDVLALVDQAERAHLAGDMEAFEIAATAAVVAIDTSATEEERRAAFEVTARLFAWEQPATPLAGLEALAEQEGEGQPWALRALGVAHASAGEYADARAVADTLATAYAESEHAAFGLGLAVRVGVAEEDEAAAVSALVALVSSFPEAEEVGALAALVLGAFPEADLSGLSGGEAAPAVTASAASAVPGSLLRVGEARPNPSSSSASVPFELADEAEVEAVLYDVLGRRIAVLASGRYTADRHTLTLEGARLPSGVYVVYVTARPGSEPASMAVRRLTFTR